MLIASVSGIRFTLDEPVRDIVAKYVAAFAKTHRGLILIGRDGRQSGLKIQKMIIETLRGMKREAEDCGTLPTPTLSLAVIDRRASGGIMISASHNPAEWNGLKFFEADGTYVHEAPC